MSELKPAARRGRSIWRWIFGTSFVVSILFNLGLVTKITVFDAYVPFRPICHRGRHGGLTVLSEPLSDRFKKEMHYNWSNLRLSFNGVLYISYWEWSNEQEDLWNVTRSVAEYVYEHQKGIKRMTQETREKLQTARCKFIRKYALKKP